MDVISRKNMYTSEKHGGPFNPQERKVMQDNFQEFYRGSDWTGLFSKVEE